MKSYCVYLLSGLAIVQALFWTVHTQQPCIFRYTMEPGPTSETCNLNGSAVNMSCIVTAPESVNYSIHWHFTRKLELAGNVNEGVINASSNSQYQFALAPVEAKDTFMSLRYDLIINSLDNSTTGYYWCSVTKQADNKRQPTPSRVLHIGYQCSQRILPSCTETISLSKMSSPTKFHCANHKLTNDSISIVDAQNIECETPATSTTKAITNAATTIPLTSPGIEQPDGTSQGLSLEMIWIGIGVVLAVLLLGVLILLAIIACLQCRRRRIKAVTAPIQQHNTYTESGETGMAERTPANKRKEVEPELASEPEYEEIRTQLSTTNRLFFNKDNAELSREDVAPFSPVSLEYEDVFIQPRQQSISPVDHYEKVELKEAPEYNRLEHSGSVQQLGRPSTSSVLSTHFSLQDKHSDFDEAKGHPNDRVENVFDDPMYAVVETHPPRTHAKVFKSKSTNTQSGDEYSHLDIDLPGPPDSENYHQALSSFVKTVPTRLITRRRSYDPSSSSAHSYTPVQSSRHKQESNYTFAIVNTEDKYISEQGHLYHVLESTQSPKQSTSEQPDSNPPPSEHSTCSLDVHTIKTRGVQNVESIHHDKEETHQSEGRHKQVTEREP